MRRGLALAAAALFFVTAVSAFSQGAIGSKTVQDFPRPNWKSVPLVVGPGDQLEVDLGWPFLAWESRTGTSHRVEAMDLVTGDRQSPFSPGQRQKYPGLYGDLLVFVSGWTSIGCSTGSCVNFLNLRDGSSSRFGGAGGPGLSKAAIAGDSYLQIEGFHSPGAPSTYFIYDLLHGTQRSYGDAEDPQAPPINGPAARDGWIAMSLLPYNGFCTPGSDFDPCVNELAVLDVSTLVPRLLTDSRATVASYNPLWEAKHYVRICGDFTWEGFPAIADSIVYWQDNRNSDFVLDYVFCEVEGTNWTCTGTI